MTDAQLPAAPEKSPAIMPAEGSAGDLSPRAAWDLVTSGSATLIDVRTTEERSFVGRVPGSEHVAWATGTAMMRNPNFVRQVSAIAAKDTTLVLLCRSGKRSASAAEALTKAGFARVFNIAEGFEGDLDDNGQRGRIDGWRFRGLPWEQD
ncbi:rhodanese-like domain-containing protein [Cereibacter sphaeroides]|uniref:rhodanese-like domain-containing protein n=1 Tax=Cereibacter sphaeroides TaxID=1063 RepID=UPI001F2925AD|nr:rhodanese-like domain-containing protein [Cereibacter sphaeroides]MCE6957567.1 rhodanese-like domain-containing protein [Cereibacter sphaeroides]MCE6971161.1 rhodanese-like domain-containing protein [Cereibacter sphaeroides]